MTEQDRKHLKEIYLAQVQSYVALKEYLRGHPDTVELVRCLAANVNALKKLGDVLKREMPDEDWPDIIGD